MSVPGRLHITWQDDSTLKVETDAGTQTRLLRFGDANAPADTPRTWQGVSVAQWQTPRPNVPLLLRPAERTADAPAVVPTGGSLRVVTTNLRAGLPAQERRPVQRERRADRALGSLQAPERRGVADDHDAGRRSAVPSHAEARRSGVQEGAERRQVGPDAVLVAMVGHMRIAALIAFVASSGGSRVRPGRSHRHVGPQRAVGQRRRGRAGRSPRNAAERGRPREGVELRHRGALGDRAAVSDVSAVLRDHRAVLAAVLDRARAGHAEAARVEDRRLGRSRRHHDLDGWTPAPVAVRAASARRVHDRNVGRRHADHRHHAFQARRHQAPSRLQQRPRDAHHALQSARRHADRHRHPRRPRVSRGAVRADRGLPLDDESERLPADRVRADRGAAAPARGPHARAALSARASTRR